MIFPENILISKNDYTYWEWPQFYHLTVTEESIESAKTSFRSMKKHTEVFKVVVNKIFCLQAMRGVLLNSIYCY